MRNELPRKQEINSAITQSDISKISELLDSCLSLSDEGAKLYSPTSLARRIGLNKAKVYDAINNGKLRFIQLGQKKYIRFSDWNTYYDNESTLLPLSKDESFTDFEEELRKQIKYGHQIAQTIASALDSDEAIQKSNLAKELWQNGFRIKDLTKSQLFLTKTK